MNLYNVIVIGGGASGISAIHRLITKGIANCVLLEAQDYLGGRIRTKEYGSHCLEYGAHWVHGEDGNVIYSLGKENNFLDENPTTKQTAYGEILFVREDGSFVAEDVINSFQFLMANITEKGEKVFPNYEDSVGKFYTNEFLTANKWGDLGMELLDWYGRFQSIHDGSDNWFQVSTASSAAYHECPGNPIINWQSGYKTLINFLQKDIPHEVICLNCPVKRIIWDFIEETSKKCCIKVELNSGESLLAKHVISTIPLAVLKDTYNSFFIPKLPTKKAEAIEKLGMGTINKIFIQFPFNWWEGCEGFSFLKPLHAIERNEETEWERDILGFYEVYKQPNMLCGWLMGSASRSMEKCSIKEVMERCIRLLKHKVGKHYNIPEPIWCDRSQWDSNPFIRGSYSFRSMESEAKGVTAKDLAVPLCSKNGSPLVCFAGEATHEFFFSTVHGAVESGWREADRILAHLRPSPTASTPSSTPKKYDVVIVGAGVSGLAIAKELESNGISNIIILEASDYVGGRVKTMYPSSGGFLEFGAQWIHGQHLNDVYALACSKGMIGREVSVDGEGDFYTDSGQRVDDGLVSEVFKVYEQIKSESCCLVPSKHGPRSVGQFMWARFEEYFNEKDDPKGNSIREAICHWLMRWERIDNACDSLHGLSPRRFGDFLRCDGFANLNPKNGMTPLVRAAIGTDVKSQINLCTEVVRIEYADVVRKENGILSNKTGGSPVLIRCGNGDVYHCDHVFVTCSLGYLKKHKDSLFSPALPSLLNESIDRIGFGVLNKVFLEFEKPFWNPHFCGCHFVWTGNETPDFNRTKPGTRTVDGRQLKMEDFWYRAITGFDPVFGHPSSLCFWIGGPEAEFMETLDESQVADACVMLVRRFTEFKNIPQPVKVYRSQWSNNKFVCGSYSNRPVSLDEMESDAIRVLNEPIFATMSPSFKVPLVSLAGEANSLNFFSTMHGAFANGTDQAKSFLRFRESSNGLKGINSWGPKSML